MGCGGGALKFQPLADELQSSNEPHRTPVFSEPASHRRLSLYAARNIFHGVALRLNVGSHSRALNIKSCNEFGWKGTWNVPSSLLSKASEECCRAIAFHLQAKYYNQGENLFVEGAEGSSIIFVNKGSVKIHLKSKEIEVLGPGTFLGELGLMFGEGRTATVTALENDCEILELSKEHFYEVMERFPNCADNIYKELSNVSKARIKSHQGSTSSMGSLIPMSPHRDGLFRAGSPRSKLSAGGAITASSPKPSLPSSPGHASARSSAAGTACHPGSDASPNLHSAATGSPHPRAPGRPASPPTADLEEEHHGVDALTATATVLRAAVRLGGHNVLNLNRRWRHSSGGAGGGEDSDEGSGHSVHVGPENARAGLLVCLDVQAFLAGPGPHCRFPGDEGPGQLLEDHFGDGTMWRVRWLLTNSWGIYATGFDNQSTLLMGTEHAKQAWTQEAFSSPGRMPSFFFCAPLPAARVDRSNMLAYSSPRSRMLMRNSVMSN